MNAKLIKVEISRNGPLWNATSPDMPGLRVTEYTREELFVQLPMVIELLCDGWSAYPVEKRAADDDLYWVAVPSHRAAAA